MTIAAGFVCEDGIVIAADTQATGYLKSDVRKYEYADAKTWMGAVLGAGDAEYVEMCRQKLLWRLAPNESAPCPRMEQIEEYCLELFERYFAPLSIYPAKDRPEAHMLIAIQPRHSKKGGDLATWTGTAFVQRFPSAFVGIGAQMAMNIERKFRGAALLMQPMRKVAAIAIYILSEVKAVVEDCGGMTEIVMLGNDGRLYYVPPGVVVEREQKYKYLDKKGMVSLAENAMQNWEEEIDMEAW